MKTIKTILFAISIAFLFSTSLKAQTPSASVLIDGTIATKIDSWSFNEMTFVFPVEDLKKFQRYRIYVGTVIGNMYGEMYLLGEFNAQNFVNTFGESGFGYCKVFWSKNTGTAKALGLDGIEGAGNLTPLMDKQLSKSFFRVTTDKTKADNPYNSVVFYIKGADVTSYKEISKDGTTIKTPIYSQETVVKGGRVSIPALCFIKKKSTDCPEIDYNIPCNVTGDKADYTIANQAQFGNTK